jgi:hypothetical protein
MNARSEQGTNEHFHGMVMNAVRNKAMLSEAEVKATTQ